MSSRRKGRWKNRLYSVNPVHFLQGFHVTVAVGTVRSNLAPTVLGILNERLNSKDKLENKKFLCMIQYRKAPEWELVGKAESEWKNHMNQEMAEKVKPKVAKHPWKSDLPRRYDSNQIGQNLSIDCQKMFRKSCWKSEYWLTTKPWVLSSICWAFRIGTTFSHNVNGIPASEDFVNKRPRDSCGGYRLERLVFEWFQVRG